MRVFVGLHRGGGFFGFANRLFTWSEYGHASLRFGDGSINDAVFEADVRKGYIQRSVADLRGPVTWFEITEHLTPQQRIRALLYAVKLKGRKYDFWGVVRFLPLVRLFYSGQILGTRKRIFCSEADMMVVSHAGLDLLNAPPHKVSPGLLAVSPYLKVPADVE
jgi:hypothetical protein